MDEEDKLEKTPPLLPPLEPERPVTPPRLDEKDFIQENYSKNPFPFWIWLALLATVAALFWGSSNWFRQNMADTVNSKPFLQVTNRQMSLFLWQFPEFMRANAPIKEGYLPGFNFRDSKFSIEQGQAEKIASAPPEVLFLYHTWARLLKPETIRRPISLVEFKEFLAALPEWQPSNWPKAPESYKKLVNSLDTISKEDFANQSETLPIEVEIAATGWLNFFKDGAEIDKVSPTLGEMENFLDQHPHYARNYWRNIVMPWRPSYLLSNFKDNFKPNEKVPSTEMAGFLQYAYFNEMQADHGHIDQKVKK